ncbi:CHAP domain-containing protein [Chitinibacter sp. GC72]|uniref:CHAP domain-containing protein n=1 Tax=Chitinibacter sp. GC72 TaxID=1526917 RepID=UPI0012FC6695|nr:CHAP domain-containing protein [Chitinibacter sp. GC72]
MSKLSDAALKLAVADEGKGEVPKGSNWGDYVKGLLAAVGVGFPAAWCAAFVYAKFMQAASQLKISNPVPRTGGVLAMWNQAKAHRVQGAPQAGDVFIMDFGGGKGHTGIVEAVIGIYVFTIEGNTNDEGSREGFEVARRKRKIADCKGFLRF